MHRLPRSIVLTGAPGSGKTVITAGLARRYSDRLVVVPEAATQVYAARNTRWDRLTIEQQRDAQRAIYRLQLDQEARARSEHPDKLILLDRGTIDGATYWPDGVEAYWRDVGTTLDTELARYDRVILLDSAATIGLYDGDASNAVRFEDPAAAIESGRRLEQWWGKHRDFHRIRARHDLCDKMAEVESLLGLAIEPD
jgi:predicted ATPase